MDSQSNTTQPTTAIPQMQSIFTDLGLDSLPEEQKKQLIDSMIDNVLNRVFTRIAPTLTSEDSQVLDTLQQQPDSDGLVANYLQSKVPNFASIMNEEVSKMKVEMQDTVATMQDTFKNPQS